MPNPWTIYNDDELLPSEKLVYLCLCRHQGKNEGSYPSHKTIASECSISVSTVKRAICKLKKRRYLEVTNRRRKDGGKTSNLYKCEK